MFPLNSLTSSDLSLDADSKRFISLMHKFGNTKGVIDGFDNFIDNASKLLTEKTYIYKAIDPKSKQQIFIEFSFSNPIKEMPKETPLECLERPNSTYGLQMFADLHVDKKTLSNELIDSRTITKVDLGLIPVILKSKYDPLMHNTDKTYEERMYEVGDDATTPPFFIVNSKKYNFNLSDQLRVGFVFSYPKNINGDMNTLITTITTESRLGKTAKISIYLHKLKKLNYIMFEDYLGYTEGRKKKSMYVLDIFSLLGFYIYKLGELETFLLEFTEPQWRQKILTALTPSLIEHRRRNSLKTDNPDNIYNYIKTFTGETGMKDEEFYRNSIDQSLFVHIGASDSTESRRTKKIALLATMVIRLLETHLGLRPPDDRNSYALKRFKNVGSAMFHLFGIFLDFRMEVFFSTYNANQNIRDDAIRNSFKEKNITQHYHNSFTKNWGLVGAISKRSKKAVFTEMLKDEEYILQHSHANKSVRGRDVHSKNYLIRKVYGSQLHAICPGETPESERVGLNQTKANSEYNSQHRDDTEIYEILKQVTKKLWKEDHYRLDTYRNTKEDSLEEIEFTDSQKENYNKVVFDSFLHLNGVILGVCNGRILERELVKLRRSKMIAFDVCIAYYSSYRTLFIFSDAGRPTAPYHIIEDSKLLIDKKNLSNVTDCLTLLDNSIYDFVDPFEMEFKNVCFSVKEYRERQAAVADIEEYIKTIKQALSEDLTLVLDLKESTLVEQKQRKYDFELKREALLSERNQHEITLKSRINELERLLSSDKESFEDRYKDISALIDTEISHLARLDVGQLDEIEIKKDVGLSKEELKTLLQAAYEEKTKRVKAATFDYCDIDPVSALGITMSLLPFSNHNPAPRQTFGCKMIKQAETIPNFSLKWNPRSTKYLSFPTRSPVETSTWTYLGMNTHPVGIPVTIAINISQSTVEDMLILSKGFVEAAGFRSVTTKCFSEDIKPAVRVEKGGEIITTIYGRLPEELTKGKPDRGYKNLNSEGFAMPGSVIRLGDILIGRYKTIANPNGTIKYKDNSIYAKRSKTGKIESYLLKGVSTIEFTLKEVKTPEVGDKFSNAHAQKSTTGSIKTETELPYSAETGITPDIQVNLHGQPSRMTFGMLREILYGKAYALTSKRFDGTAYRDREETDIDVEQTLASWGLASKGKEVMVSETGEFFTNDIYVGICYYYRLVHESGYKIQNRDVGAYKQITHQPSTGMDNIGGQKQGEMEIESLEGHGAVYTVKAYTTLQSDYYIYHSCRFCTHKIFKTQNGVFYCSNCSQFLKEEDVLFAESTYTLQTLNNYEEGMGIQLRIKLQQTDKQDEEY